MAAIIAQEAMAVASKETLKLLEQKIRAVEHKLYPRVVDLLVRGKLKVVGRKVVFRS